MISMTVEDGGVAERLARMGAAISDALTRTATLLATELQSRIRDGLDGDVLKSRTGALRDSITTDVQPDSSQSGVVATVGSDLPYAAFQEQGFTGAEQVSEHLRRMTMAFGRPVVNPHDVLVRSFTRNVDYAGTQFLSGPLEEMREHIAIAFDGAVRQELRP